MNQKENNTEISFTWDSESEGYYKRHKLSKSTYFYAKPKTQKLLSKEKIHEDLGYTSGRFRDTDTAR